ncbi:hypothetical protein CEUSTIGMA_g8845.t1 [Chlamydomonas eustigma]|uniref:S-acyltransferase n=1 Tax=Chlamydomonas eustigma TaxID=1157962 RepID=A0A250XEB2_9CHLO|nr:hypothetical protein CEUSTIGMA_g8845.t1 [Chlamydomonas eustigma]|eukprot:GAX81415.1 hypothetical protein CEUSTIGMA_g8845.t1 [Chlamydomonas eustigma]
MLTQNSCCDLLFINFAHTLTAILFCQCGALTEYMRSERPPRPKTLFRQVMTVLSSLKWGLVVMVVLLTFSIILPGAIVVLPVTSGFSTPILYFCHFLTWLLSFNVLFNFASAVLHSPGSVKHCDSSLSRLKDGQPIPQGAFNNFLYCFECKFFKPPETHHCRMCGTCVVEMDHHCPFIANCVGKGNYRSFLLFLMWTMAAMLYCILHTVRFLYIQRVSVYSSLLKAWNMASGMDYLLLTLYIFMASTWEQCAALYVFSAACCVGGGVTILFGSQIMPIIQDCVRIQQQQQQLLVTASQPHAPAAAVSSQAAALSTLHDENMMKTGGGENACESHPQAVPLTMRRSVDNYMTRNLLQRAVELEMMVLARLNRIMGGDSLMYWALPIWGPAPGTCGGVDSVKKCL